MRREHDALRLGLGLLLIGLLGGVPVAAGEEKPAPKEPPALTPEQLHEALAGFKGFLAGDVVKREKTGAVLFVRSVTIVEGSQAKNPALLLGREAPVDYATEKDEKGAERPMKALVGLMQRLEKLPFFALGGPGGGNMVIALDDGGAGAVAGGANVQVHGVTLKATTMRMEVNGQQIEIGGDDAEKGAGKAAKPKGPAATLRVKAAADGKLVSDRALPGLQPAATWDGMAKLQFAGVEEAAEPQEAPKEEKPPARKDAQF